MLIDGNVVNHMKGPIFNREFNHDGWVKLFVSIPNSDKKAQISYGMSNEELARYFHDITYKVFWEDQVGNHTEDLFLNHWVDVLSK